MCWDILLSSLNTTAGKLTSNLSYNQRSEDLSLEVCLNNSVLNVKVLVGALNQEKVLLEAFSVIVKSSRTVAYHTFQALFQPTWMSSAQASVHGEVWLSAVQLPSYCLATLHNTSSRLFFNSSIQQVILKLWNFESQCKCRWIFESLPISLKIHLSLLILSLSVPCTKCRLI